MIKQEEPLAHQLIQVTKKYLSEFARMSQHIPMERYHYVLLLIYENDGFYAQKDLAKILQVDKSFMVTMIDYLSAQDFVVRETNPLDRRQHLLKLTSKAMKIIPDINDAFKKLNQQAFLNVTVEKINIFFEVITAIQKNFNNKSTHEIILDYKKINIK